MKTKKREWKRSKRGNIYRKHRDGMVIAFQRSNDNRYGLMWRPFSSDDQPTFCGRNFETEEEAVEGASEFIADLKNTATPW